MALQPRGCWTGRLVALAGGPAVWLLHGISIGSLPLILVDAAGLLAGLATLVITLSARGSLTRPRTWRACATLILR